MALLTDLERVTPLRKLETIHFVVFKLSVLTSPSTHSSLVCDFYSSHGKLIHSIGTNLNVYFVNAPIA